MLRTPLAIHNLLSLISQDQTALAEGFLLDNIKERVPSGPCECLGLGGSSGFRVAARRVYLETDA